MSLNAATIEILIAKGLSAADILDVARATEVKKDATNSERQARFRARRKGASNAVTVTDGAPYEDTSTPSSPSVSSEPNGSTETAPRIELKVEHVVEAWNSTAEHFGLRAVRKLTPDRRRKIATRIRQNTIEDFTEAIAAIARSPFLRGENDRGWRADFDWMLEPKNFTKLTEGTYDRS